MGRSNIPLLDARTVGTDLADAVAKVSGPIKTIHLLGREVRSRDAVNLLAAGFLVVALAGLLRTFLGTSLGPRCERPGTTLGLIRAMGVNVGRMITLGLMMSNALVALSGAILAQYQGFADIQMGIGMIVWGLASVILGQALVGGGGMGLPICGAVLGSLLFRLMVALALRWGLDPNDLKLITAAFVFAALVLPRVFAGRPRSGRGPYHPRGAEHGITRAARGLQDVQPGYPRRGPGAAGRGSDDRAGSFVVVIGTNGSGKSTTLNSVAGSFRVDAGTIRLAGRDITNWPEHRRAKLIGRVFQDPLAGTSPSLSIAENLALASGGAPAASAGRCPGAMPTSSASGSGRSGWGWKTASTTRSAASPGASARH